LAQGPPHYVRLFFLQVGPRDSDGATRPTPSFCSHRKADRSSLGGNPGRAVIQPARYPGTTSVLWYNKQRFALLDQQLAPAECLTSRRTPIFVRHPVGGGTSAVSCPTVEEAGPHFYERGSARGGYHARPGGPSMRSVRGWVTPNRRGAATTPVRCASTEGTGTGRPVDNGPYRRKRLCRAGDSGGTRPAERGVRIARYRRVEVELRAAVVGADLYRCRHDDVRRTGTAGATASVRWSCVSSQLR
jgi:hypothetical protein